MTRSSGPCHGCDRKPSQENALTPPPWSGQLSSLALPRVEIDLGKTYRLEGGHGLPPP